MGSGRGGFEKGQLDFDGDTVPDVGSAVASEEAKAGKVGFDFDNTIGATPQPNGWMDDWVEFYRERRMGMLL